MQVKFFIGILGLALFVGFLGSGKAADQMDSQLEELNEYVEVSGIAGDLSSVGSDTLANLMTLWAEEFNRLYPGVTIQIQAPGSSAAAPALIENTANLGPMSRKMKSKEIEAFEREYGYKPTPIRVAIDALAVYVHKDNPIKGMTLPQVDAVFSATRKCGYPRNISTWGDLGLEGVWKNRRIQLFGRNSASGTYGYFKEVALCKGDFKKTVNEQPGSASVVQAVAQSLDSIGYSGIGYRTSGVRAVPLAVKADAPYVKPTPENTLSGQYPLARFLYIYVNKHPNKPLPPLEREFIKMVLSKRGQAVVIKDGYIPLPARIAEKELSKIGVGIGTD